MSETENKPIITSDVTDDKAKHQQEIHAWAEQHLNLYQEPISIEELTDTLGSTVKHDDTNKAITFLAMLLTYSAEDQVNLAFLAESSTGKSYIPLELSSYFPPEDVKEYGYVSPTAFFHDYGAYDKETHTIYVNLERKIMVYLDQPHDELLKRMRPLFSHDRKNMMLKITDRSEKGGTRAKNIMITGYSTNIFCSCKYNMDEQEKTRQLLLSPETSQEKIREAVILRLQKEGNREEYAKAILENQKRKKLGLRVWQIKTAKIDYINIPADLIETIQKRFLDNHPHLQSRQTRDITRLLCIIKGNALLNFMHRTKTENTIEANTDDVEVGFKLYAEVSDANELGMPPEIYKVYTELKPDMDLCSQAIDSEKPEEAKPEGFTRRDFQKMYWQKFQKYLGRPKVESILKTLVDIGLLNEEQDSADKRKWRYDSRGVYVNTLIDKPRDKPKYRPKLTRIRKKPSVHTPQANHCLESSQPLTIVKSAPNKAATVQAIEDETLTCGHCAKHETGSCIQPNPKMIVPTAVYAKTCPSYTPRIEQDRALALGTVSVFNGESVKAGIL